MLRGHSVTAAHKRRKKYVVWLILKRIISCPIFAERRIEAEITQKRVVYRGITAGREIIHIENAVYSDIIMNSICKSVHIRIIFNC